MWETQKPVSEAYFWRVETYKAQTETTKFQMENIELRTKIKTLQSWVTFLFISAIWLLIIVCYLVWNWPK